MLIVHADRLEELTLGLRGPPGPQGLTRHGRPGKQGVTGIPGQQTHFSLLLLLLLLLVQMPLVVEYSDDLSSILGQRLVYQVGIYCYLESKY